MKKKNYLKKALKQVDNKGRILCDDCGEITKIGHAIVNHQYNTVKVVCDNCFKDKYMDFIYPDGK